MSAFAIWFFILTGIYLFYYAGTICFDLFVKKQAVKKEDVEVFNTSGIIEDDDDASSVAVHERKSGGHAFGDDFLEEEASAPVSSSSDVSDDSGPAANPIQQQEQREDADMVDRMRDAKLNPVPVSFQEEYYLDEYSIVMAGPKTSTSRIFRELVNDRM